MSSPETPSGPSRHTNLNNSVTPAEPGSSLNSDFGLDNPDVDVGTLVDLHERELPTSAERVAEFYETYPDLARLELTGRHGQSIRREYTHERYESWESEPAHEWENGVKGDRVAERRPYTWGEAVRETLESHEDTRRTTVNLELGRPSDPEYQTYSVDAVTRWFASYQRRYYAQMKAWLRELCGGERPSGGTTEPSYEDPHIGLITLSASSVPNGERVGPLDHTEKRRESWRDCYDTMRNTLEALGYEGDRWQYDRRTEPHTGERGGMLNRCYGHDHIVIVTDGPLSAADLRPVVEKHVESCDWAGAKAHDLDVRDWDANADDVDTVTVKPADKVDNLANYVASYCGIQPLDLHERSIEYVAWASAVTAANVRTVSRSDPAKWAATADACRQRAESPHSEQEHDHGERIIPSLTRGAELECAECGSPHGIDQDQTLTAARLSGGDTAIADGGLVDRREQLMERWPSARAGARLGETPKRSRWRRLIQDFLKQNPDAKPAQILGQLGLPPDARDVLAEIEAGIDPNEPVSFERPPKWHVKSVTIGQEEYPASAGNGVEMVETRMPVERLLEETELGNDDADGTYWRCETTGVAMYGGRKMAAYLVDHGIEHPWVVEDVVTAERIPNPDGPGTIRSSGTIRTSPSTSDNEDSVPESIAGSFPSSDSSSSS